MSNARSKQKLWGEYAERNPAFRSDETRIKISVASLRAMCEQFYDEGERAAESRRKFVEDIMGRFRPVS